jgi:hypothetical protein
MARPQIREKQQPDPRRPDHCEDEVAVPGPSQRWHRTGECPTPHYSSVLQDQLLHSTKLPPRT